MGWPTPPPRWTGPPPPRDGNPCQKYLGPKIPKGPNSRECVGPKIPRSSSLFCTPIAEVTPILPDLPRLPAISLQQIAELEREIDRLQRTEEAIVVATGAPRERG